MAKDTVEDSKPLDAWKLAREGWFTPGKVCISRWTRGDAVTGTVSFQAMDGAIRFRYTQTDYWTDIERSHDYVVEVIRTPATVGGERVWFLCPRCYRRVRMLYLPPNAGRFACRHCHNLAYSSQHQSRRYRAIDRLFRLADRLDRPSPTLGAFLAKHDAFEAAQAATLGRWEAESQRRAAKLASQLRGRGRPSKRSLRERARLEREASRPPVPDTPRPRGRPKLKREYVHRQPAPELSQFQPEQQAYCVKCRDRRDLKWARATVLSNGRSAIRGRCTVCRTRILRLTIQKRDEQ
jgi:hypothetical protein